MMSTFDKAGERAFVVDDDPFHLSVLTRQLASEGVERVESFESAADLLRQIDGASAASRLLLLDLNMPDIDGIELIRHLAQRNYRGALILVSSENERVLDAASQVVRAHHLDLVGKLSKPVAPERLSTLLSRWRTHRSSVVVSATRRFRADELRDGIRSGQLELHFQPQIDLTSGQVASVEALVRWRHPIEGLVFPDRFVPLAEEEGVIDELTRWVIKAAVAQFAELRRIGRVRRVSINVSMIDLARLDFPDFLLEAMSRARVRPDEVVIEVTESRVVDDVAAALNVLARLRLRQIGLAIDDFGTGYSTLAQLRDFPFDELKIDRGFVHGAHADTALRAILEASLAMAGKLGLRAVAEGVEDDADWCFLRQRGCALAQGYFIARPMPADALPDWIGAWNARYRGLP